MKSFINQFGELQTQWQSHKHPENVSFMQVVFWSVFEKESKTTICWHLGNPSNAHFIYGMTKDECIAKYTDSVDAEITEQDFQNWLNSKINV